MQGEFTMNIHFRLGLGAIAALLAVLIPSIADAKPITVTTERVQIRVSDNGSVQINTAGNQPTLSNSRSTIGSQTWLSDRSTTLPFGHRCLPRANSVQRHSSRTTDSGSAIYSESRTSTLVCP
jgi:hypothetical protein